MKEYVSCPETLGFVAVELTDDNNIIINEDFSFHYQGFCEEQVREYLNRVDVEEKDFPIILDAVQKYIDLAEDKPCICCKCEKRFDASESDYYNELCSQLDYWGESSLTEDQQLFMEGKICEDCIE